MTRDETIDDFRRRLVDHRDLINDPVKVIMQVAIDMKQETREGSFLDRLKRDGLVER